MLVLLDVLASFDTIDHHLILKRLSDIVVTDITLELFQSYLDDCHQFISIKGTTPQRVGLHLKHEYLRDRCWDLWYSHNTLCQLEHYVDANVLIISCLLMTAQGTAHIIIEICIIDIRTWMALHRLKLIDDKMECVLTVTIY